MLGSSECSPAIDAGDNSLLPADLFDLDEDGDTTEPIPVDLGGQGRIQTSSSTTVNMGAYEEVYRGAGGIDGDLNEDGFVNSEDLDIIRAHWGEEVDPGDCSMGDATEDGYVGSADLDIIRANWGRSETWKVASASASESAPRSEKKDAREAATAAVFGDIQALAEANWRAAVNALKDDANEPSGPKRRNAIDLAWLERR